MADETTTRFRELAELAHGWDGYEGIPPTTTALVAARAVTRPRIYRPRIYLTSAAAVGAVRAGRATAATRHCVPRPDAPVYSIMRWPNAKRNPMEPGEGRVIALTPTVDELRRVQAGLHPADYFAGLRRRWARHADLLVPGVLIWGEDVGIWDEGGDEWDGARWRRRATVPDGAVLVCACSIAKASAGQCHRVAAGGALHDAGWSVTLDGEPWPRATQGTLL